MKINLIASIESHNARPPAYTPPPPPPLVESMARAVCWRLENPKLKDSQVKNKAPLASPRTPLPDTLPALTGHVEIKLSAADREEVASVCAAALVSTFQAGLGWRRHCLEYVDIQDATRPNMISFPKKAGGWKRVESPAPFDAVLNAFKMARAALEMGQSKHARRVYQTLSLDSPELKDGIEWRAAMLVGEAQDEQRAALARAALAMREILRAAHANDNAPRRVWKFHNARRTLRFFVGLANGRGWQEWRDLADNTRSMRIKTFKQYCAIGMNAPRPARPARPASPARPAPAPAPAPGFSLSPAFDGIDGALMELARAGLSPAFNAPPSPYHETRAVARMTRPARVSLKSAWRNFDFRATRQAGLGWQRMEIE